MKLNKYQKIVLLLYSITFIYFSIINVPFKIRRGNEIDYDTLFSNKANIDFSRLFLVIIITTLISGILFLVVGNLRVAFKLNPRLKLKPAFYILTGIIIVVASVFLVVQKYGNKFSSNEPAKKIYSDSVPINSDTKIQTTLPILHETLQIDTPPFLKNKYLYNGENFEFADVLNAAKQSNLDVDEYIKKVGIVVVDEKGLTIHGAILKKYRTPNGKIVEESILRQKYGSRFDSLVNDSTFTAYYETGQAKKLKMILPNGSIKDIEGDDVTVAESLGWKPYQPDNKAKIKMIFPDGSIGEIPLKAVDNALKAGAKRLTK